MRIYNYVIPKGTAGPIKGFREVGNWQKWDDFKQQIDVKQGSVAPSIGRPINYRYKTSHLHFYIGVLFFCVFIKWELKSIDSWYYKIPTSLFPFLFFGFICYFNIWNIFKNIVFLKCFNISTNFCYYIFII